MSPSVCACVVPSDVRLIGGATLLMLVCVAAFWKEFKLLSFDPEFAASAGFSRVGLELALNALLAFAVTLGLQLVGVVLMAALITAPAAAARQLSRSLGQMVGLAALFGALAGVAGAVVSSSGQALATGPLIVIAASLITLLALLFAPERGLVAGAVRARRARRRLNARRVLLDLYKLANGHGDPRYPSEEGALRALYGGPVTAQLRRLEAAGLLERARHEPGEGAHVRLTAAGFARAETVLTEMSGSRA